AIVIERYDRATVAGTVARVHQEDMCQAHGLPPTRKYENEGGPGILKIVDLLRNHSTEAEEGVGRFLDAIAFHWLIAGTDAHAKNYSVLMGANANVRLAPLYDIASILPYKRMNLMKAALAMKIGGTYRLRQIGRRQWQKLAAGLRLDPDALISRISQMAESLPESAQEVRRRVETAGLSHPLIARLADALAIRATQCRRQLRQNA